LDNNGHFLHAKAESFNMISLHNTTVDAPSQLSGSIFFLGPSTASGGDVSYSSLALFSLNVSNVATATTVVVGNGSKVIFDNSTLDLSSLTIEARGAKRELNQPGKLQEYLAQQRLCSDFD